MLSSSPLSLADRQRWARRIVAAQLADMEEEEVAQTLSTDVLRATLQSRGYHVEPPAGWPRLVDDE